MRVANQRQSLRARLRHARACCVTPKSCRRATNVFSLSGFSNSTWGPVDTVVVHVTDCARSAQRHPKNSTRRGAQQISSTRELVRAHMEAVHAVEDQRLQREALACHVTRKLSHDDSQAARHATAPAVFDPNTISCTQRRFSSRKALACAHVSPASKAPRRRRCRPGQATPC